MVRRNQVLLAVALLFMLGAGGCASRGGLDAGDFDVLIPVQVPVRDGTYGEGQKPGCVLELLLAYYGLAPVLEAGVREGSPPGAELDANQVEAYLTQQGLEVFVFAGELGEGPTGLEHHLELGRPLLVLLGMPDGTFRWELVVGYSADRRLVALQGTAGRLWALPAGTFDHAWERTGRVCVLAALSPNPLASTSP